MNRLIWKVRRFLEKIGLLKRNYWHDPELKWMVNKTIDLIYVMGYTEEEAIRLMKLKMEW